MADLAAPWPLLRRKALFRADAADLSGQRPADAPCEARPPQERRLDRPSGPCGAGLRTAARHGRLEPPMSAVLGISAYYHDSAAALIIDGKIVAAMQEERFSRRKNDPGLPCRAAHACLEVGGIEAGDLDSVVFYENPYGRLERVVMSSLGAFPRSWRQFPHALRSQIGNKIWVLDGIASMLGVPRSLVTSVGHHQSHAASAFLPSPFEEAAVLTVDGMGEGESTAIWHGRGTELTCFASIPYPNSIGLL